VADATSTMPISEPEPFASPPPAPHEMITMPATEQTTPNAWRRSRRWCRNAHSPSAVIAGMVPSTTAAEATEARCWPAL
jgi:hypothetical protein